MRKIIASVDIGSDFIKLVVGEFVRGKLNILGVSSVPSVGVKRGKVVDGNALLPKLQEVFLKCEDMIGLKISKVVLSLPSDGVEFFFQEGSSTITNSEHIVKEIDVLHAMQASTYNKIEHSREIVSIKPTSFLIDEERTVKNPIGLEATKITVKSLVITVPRENAAYFVKCLEKIGVEVIDFSLSTIGDFYELSTPMMKEVVGAIINIGYHTTTVSIFNKGLLTNTDTIKVGAYHIEKDYAYLFGVTKNDAKIIKNELASSHKRGTSASVKQDFTTIDGNTITINEYEASEVCSSRIAEILKLAKKQINLLTKKEIHYIMITGGVSEMANFNILVEEVFGHNAKIGSIKELGVRSNIYSAVVGLLKYYDEKTKLSQVEFSIFNEEETEELSNVSKKISFGENSILGKLFGYFFDN